MKPARRSPPQVETLVVLIALLALATAACQPAPPPPAPPPSPPPAYLSDDAIRASMWALAAEIRLIDALVRNAETRPTADTTERLRGSLDRMQVAAQRLSPPRAPGHPVLSIHLDDFMLRLEQARRALDRTPPDFYRSAALAGGCFLCHSLETEAAWQSGPLESRTGPLARGPAPSRATDTW